MNFLAIDVTRVGNPHAPLMSNIVTKFRKRHFKTPALPCGDVAGGGVINLNIVDGAHKQN